jgi:hypothetical protein
MKKIHEIHALYGAHTAGLILKKKKGELIIYESQPGFITLPDGVYNVRKVPASRCTRVCDQRKTTNPGVAGPRETCHHLIPVGNWMR